MGRGGRVIDKADTVYIIHTALSPVCMYLTSTNRTKQTKHISHLTICSHTSASITLTRQDKGHLVPRMYNWDSPLSTHRQGGSKNGYHKAMREGS